MKKRALSIFGISVTIIYGVLLYFIVKDQLPNLETLELNNIGDFLAGAFGPLAIFWLILGFFQQGKELQQSTQALKLQAKELNDSVKQQEKLVNISKEQIEEIRRASIRPNLQIYLQPNIASMQFMDLHIENSGNGTAKDIKFYFYKENGLVLQGIDQELVNKFLKLNMLKTGISSFAPKEKRSSFIFSFTDLDTDLKENIFDVQFVIKIQYSDIEGYKYISTSTVDIGEYDGIVEVGGEPSYKIYKEVEKIRKILEGFKGHSTSQRLKVDVFTSKNRDDDNKALEKRLGLNVVDKNK